MKKIFVTLFTSALMLGGLSSCTNNDEPNTENVWVTMDFTLSEENYNTDNYWVDVYDTEQGAFGIYPMIFSHKADSYTYDGVTYKSFTGFCPSIVNDQADHTGSDWTQYQFGSIAPNHGFGYLIAHWDTRETASTELKDRSCLIEFGTSVTPVAMTVTNTSYAYWVMKNGSAFSRPFTASDYLILDIYAVNKGVAQLATSVYLADRGNLVDTWQTVDLSMLGTVQQIYFSMRSSDSGEWGMNTPAYFAIGSIQAIYPGMSK